METKVKNKFMPVGKSKLIEGSIAMPELANLCLIAIPVSETGKPENPVYDILDKKWKNVKADVKGWHASNIDFKMGSVHSLSVQSDVWCVSMLCLTKTGELDEAALIKCVKELAKLAKSEKGSVHFSTMTLDAIPQLGDMAAEFLLDEGVNTYFYDQNDRDKTV